MEPVAAVARDTRAAERLTALYEAYASDAFRFALHLTGRREDAEDVVQQVFLQAYATMEAGRCLASPRAWLMKVTKHRSLNLVRDRHDAPVAEIERQARDPVPDAEAEALADVRAILWSLPRPQHQAFVLRHWSGLSQDEIADVLATTPHAVESLLVRARAALVAERDAGDPECAGVRRRLARMLEPTPAQSVHVAECRRCRTAQMRLLRTAGHAAALVPGPHVLHALAASVPGFGTSGALAGAAATASTAGSGGGGAAISATSAATKAGIAAKIAVAATTAAVAVTAVHPLRSAVTHTVLHHAPATPVATASPPPAAPRAARKAGPRRATVHSLRPASRPGGHRSTEHGKGRGSAHRGAGPAHGKAAIARGKSASTHGKSASAHRKSATAPGKAGVAHGKAGVAHGKSASAPGHTKAPGSHAAAGKGAGRPHPGHGPSHSHGEPSSRSRGRHKGKG